jgi:hypothetical protein
MDSGAGHYDPAGGCLRLHTRAQDRQCAIPLSFPFKRNPEPDRDTGQQPVPAPFQPLPGIGDASRKRLIRCPRHHGHQPPQDRKQPGSDIRPSVCERYRALLSQRQRSLPCSALRLAHDACDFGTQHRNVEPRRKRRSVHDRSQFRDSDGASTEGRPRSSIGYGSRRRFWWVFDHCELPDPKLFGLSTALFA